jgi:serine protease Do
MSKLSMVVCVPLLFGLCALVHGQPAGEAKQQQRPFLGVAVSPANEDGTGVKIAQITADSPAAKAGIKEGDVITKVNGKDVPEVTEFLKAVGSNKVGDKLKMTVMRDGKEQSVTATLGPRPADFGQPPPQPGGGRPPFPQFPGELKGQFGQAMLGVQAEPLTAELKQQLKVKADAGAVVMDVLPNSAAAKAGLKKDDVITAVDNHTVKGPEDLRNAIQKVGGGKEATVHIQRGGESKDVRVTLQAGGFPGGILPSGGIFGGDQSQRIQDLERRIETLEKRLRELEKQRSPK